jgi:hypothetical protein
MFRPNQVMLESKDKDAELIEMPRKRITALKYMALTPNSSLRCLVIRPRYAKLNHIKYDQNLKAIKVLDRVKTMRLLTFKLINSKKSPKYNGELTRLLLSTHYLRTFHFLYYLPRNKDFQTVRKLILKQKNIQSLALLSNWGKLSRFKKIKKPNVQIRMVHKSGKQLRRLVLANVLDIDVGHHFKPQYLPNLETFIFGTTCTDIYNCYPQYNGITHGKLVQKLLRMPTLRKLNVRTCENFTHKSFWEVLGESLAERNEPIDIDIGCGIRGWYDESEEDYADEYEEELRKYIGSLKSGQTFNYSSSWNEFTIKGGSNENDSIEEEDEDL